MVLYTSFVKNDLEGHGLTREQISGWWWPRFKEKYDWRLLRVTTHRRKLYEAGEKARAILRFANYVRKLKLKHKYPTELILNFDECPCWFDMPSKRCLNHKSSKKTVPISLSLIAFI